MTAAAPAVRNDAKPSLAQLIQQMKPEIAKALPRHMNPDRMARIATTVLRQTPALARCTPESFLGALLTASQLGLEPGPTGDAHFVPFGSVCTFIPGYRGLIKLARNSGLVADIWAEIVYEKDTFSYTLGLHRDLQHVPAIADDRGKPIYVYAAAELRDGARPFVVLTVAEVEAIRARSKAARNGPWVTDWAAMARKTAVKQLAKWLPLSPEFNTAVVLDGSVRTQVGSLVDVQPDFVDGEVDGTAAIEPGLGGGNEQSQGAEPSSGADVAPDSGDPEPTPDVPEVRMASDAQLAKLAIIRDERYAKTDKGRRDWFAWCGSMIERDISSNKELSLDEATLLIDLLESSGGAK